MLTTLERISKLAGENRETQFTSLAHHINPDTLEMAFEKLRKDASAGSDGITYEEYQREARRNIQELHGRLKSWKYRAQPLKRIYIPKDDGKERPISIPSLEDKIVQRAVVTLLNAIYEVDFHPNSYGFRPERSAQDALDQVYRVTTRTPVEWVLEADIQGYFDAIVKKELMVMMEKRVKDKSILRLIGKWLNVGVISEGRLLNSEERGVGQGQVISPLLGNIYLHYVLDEWFEEVVKPKLRGYAQLIRYADDFVLCFQHKHDAERVMEVIGKRFAKYGLTLHPDKTKLIHFGPEALSDSEKPGGKPPGTFDLLGFTHIATRSHSGRFTIHVRTMDKRLAKSAKRMYAWCKAQRHDKLGDQQEGINRKLNGHYNYYGRPTNYRALLEMQRCTLRSWFKWLNRRTRGKTLTWEIFKKILAKYPLVKPRITHAWVPW